MWARARTMCISESSSSTVSESRSGVDCCNTVGLKVGLGSRVKTPLKIGPGGRDR